MRLHPVSASTSRTLWPFLFRLGRTTRVEYLAPTGQSLCVLFLIFFLHERATSKHLRRELESLRLRALETTDTPAVLAYEIRAPLALTRGAGEFLSEGMVEELADTQRQFLHTMMTSTQRVIALAESMLTDLELYSSDPFATGPVDIREAVASAAREMRRISDTPIRVDTPGGALIIPANALMIRQLIWNLLNDLLRHASSKTVIVSAAPAEGGGAFTSIEDSGTDIPEDEQEIVLAPLISDSAPNPGTGVGMAVVGRIVGAHGGSLTIDSVKGRGTAVHIRLPGE